MAFPITNLSMPSVKRYSNKSRYSPYNNKRNNSKNYRKYYYKQPKSTALVEEPTDSEQSDSEDLHYELNENDSEGEVYDIYQVESDVDRNGNIIYRAVDEDSDIDSEFYSDSEQEEFFDIVDLNDELQNDAVEYMIDSGDIEDINDQLIRLYDSASESEDSDSDSDSDDSLCSDSDCDDCLAPCSDSDCDDCLESCSDSDCQECSDSDSDFDSEDDAENLDKILTYFEDNDVFEPELSDEELIDEDTLIENMSEDELFNEVFGDFIEENFDDSSSDSDYDSDNSSITDEIEFSPDIDQLNDQLKLENVRLYFQDDLDRVNAMSSDEEDDLELDDDEIKYIEAGKYYDSSDESTDDEGVTIYRHRFDMPEQESDQDSTDEELVAYNSSDSESDSSDSECEDCDGCQVIDLSEELANSKDFECQEFDDHYKINIRLPSINQEELNIDFAKNQNELIITGKFDFNVDDVAYLDEDEIDEIIEDDEEEIADSEEEQEQAEAEEDAEIAEEEIIEKETEEQEEQEEKATEKADEDVEIAGSEEEDESYSDSSSEDEEFSGFVDEEMLEEAENLINDFQNHEITFEKHFTFDKIVKFEEIKAKFINEDELEIIVPREDIDVDTNNLVKISIDKEDEETFEDASI